MSEPVRVVAFVPAAPLLVPQVAAGSADLDAGLREACVCVARRLTTAAEAGVTIVAPVAAGASWPANATWGFEGFGVAREPSDERPRLPWPLGIGDWLLDVIGWTGERHYVGVTPDSGTTGAAEIDAALLVVGDGSARRTEKAPGYLDERATGFDEVVATAIRAGDNAALGSIDQALADDLLCAGAPVWRWLSTRIGAGSVVEAELLADTAPYGVGYFAGWWRLG
ncbi:MAG TPA: hypothetical protein VHC43_03020 [Mycobacteriales bacterium]|nr:hypothetical protein [Mycobacteriales bacterium]